MSVLGLLALVLLRCCAAEVYAAPAGLHWTAHVLSVAADSISVVGSIPILTTDCMGACIAYRCLGSLLTLLLTAALCDIGAVIIFFTTAGGNVLALMGSVATSEGAPSSLAFIGVWECILVSSLSLEAALCVSAWRFYRAFREAGIYPPDADGSLMQKEVSHLELVCEAEDVALLSEHCSTSCGGEASQPRVESRHASRPMAPPPGLPPGLLDLPGLPGLLQGEGVEIQEEVISVRNCWAAR